MQTGRAMLSTFKNSLSHFGIHSLNKNPVVNQALLQFDWWLTVSLIAKVQRGFNLNGGLKQNSRYQLQCIKMSWLRYPSYTTFQQHFKFPILLQLLLCLLICRIDARTTAPFGPLLATHYEITWLHNRLPAFLSSASLSENPRLTLRPEYGHKMIFNHVW